MCVLLNIIQPYNAVSTETYNETRDLANWSWRTWKLELPQYCVVTMGSRLSDAFLCLLHNPVKKIL